HWSTLYPTTGKTQLVDGLDVTTGALHRARKPSHTRCSILALDVPEMALMPYSHGQRHSH
ncbi:hypothetical protein, partial [Dickeya ananatis]